MKLTVACRYIIVLIIQTHVKNKLLTLTKNEFQATTSVEIFVTSAVTGISTTQAFIFKFEIINNNIITNNNFIESLLYFLRIFKKLILLVINTCIIKL